MRARERFGGAGERADDVDLKRWTVERDDEDPVVATRIGADCFRSPLVILASSTDDTIAQ